MRTDEYIIIFQSLVDDYNNNYDNETDYEIYGTVEDAKTSAYNQLFYEQRTFPDQILIAYTYDESGQRNDIENIQDETDINVVCMGSPLYDDNDIIWTNMNQ